MTGASFGTFTFDGAGSPTTYQGKALVFDPEDRLVSALGATFTYDGDGKRVTKTVGGVTTYYLYDGGQVIDEETQADPANPVVAAYGWGVDGLRARYSFPGSPAADLPADSSLAYLYDPSGNVSERLELLYNNGMDQSGQGLYVQVRDYQIFDAFGLLSGRIDTVSYPSVPMDLDPVGFGGQYGYYTDQETGLVLLGARYYDPSTGRFLNRDPIGYDGGINLYGFAGNNPVNETDPEGTSNGEAGTDIRAPGLIAVQIMAAQKAARDRAAAAAKARAAAEAYAEDATIGAMLSMPAPSVGGDDIPPIPVAPAAERPASSPNYSVGFEARLQHGVDYPGRTEEHHFAVSNGQVHRYIQSNPEGARQLEEAFPGITNGVAPGRRGGFPRRPPTSTTTWHHHPTRPGVMQLVYRGQHRAPGAVQQSLHPNQSGGMENWGGGR